MPRGGKRPGAGRPRIHAPQGDGPKRPPWRPSKYDPAFCDMIVEAAQAGHSITGFAGSLGVSRSTLTNWMNEFPEFMAAAEASKSVQSYAWERKAIRVGDTGGGPGTATIITFMLKNLAPEQYAEKKTLEHVGANGGPIQSAQMDPDQFEAIARKIADEI